MKMCKNPYTRITVALTGELHPNNLELLTKTVAILLKLVDVKNESVTVHIERLKMTPSEYLHRKRLRRKLVLPHR